MPPTSAARQAHTTAELDRVIGPLRGIGAELVSVGHGRAGTSTDTANAFAAGDQATGLSEGRLNITLRVTGLAD